MTRIGSQRHKKNGEWLHVFVLFDQHQAILQELKVHAVQCM
jgi:hypothetical protein